jgi:hypothetical protein
MPSAGFAIDNNSGGYAFKVDPDGNIKIGDTSDDTVDITGSTYSTSPASFAQAGASLAGEYFFRVGDVSKTPALYVSSSNHIGIATDQPDFYLDVAGSTRIRSSLMLDEGTLSATQTCTGTSTTLNTFFGPVRYLQTTSATGNGGIHAITIPDGTNTGEVVKIIFLDTPANGTSIEFSTTNFLGVSSLGLPGSGFMGGGAQGGCLDLIWTGSKWVIISANHKVSAS